MGSETAGAELASQRERANVEFGPEAPPDMDGDSRKDRHLGTKPARPEENGRCGGAQGKEKRDKAGDMLLESPSDSDSSSRSGSGTSSSASATSSCTSSDTEKIKRRRKRSAGRRNSRALAQDCDSDSEVETDKRSRKSKQKRRNDRNKRKEDKGEKKKRDKKRKRDESSDSEDSSRSRDRGRSRLKEKHGRHHSSSDDKQRSHKKRKSKVSRSKDRKDDGVKHVSVAKLQVAMEERDQQKALIRRNAELAKARLASGELQRARKEQMEMQRLYGAVDWRAKKKLQSEKKKLERTVAAGNKLAKMEERESARMDAFRVALGLPTAEAQRQAEWRAEATRALNEMEVLGKDVSPGFRARVNQRNGKPGIIGPRLPPT